MINRGSFASRLVELLKNNKVTTATLSKATNISEITINKMRNGQNLNPTITTIIAIARYFNVSIDYLVSEPGIFNPKLLSVTDIDAIGEAEYTSVNTDDLFIGVDFAIRITSHNYPNFKKNSLVLINRRAVFSNDETVLVKLNDAYILCNLIIEGNMYVGKSLTISEKYYDIKMDNIIGTVIGVVWKSN